MLSNDLSFHRNINIFSILFNKHRQKMSTVNKEIAKSYEKHVNKDKHSEFDLDGEVRTLMLVRDLYGHKNKEKKSNACTHVNHFLKYHYQPKNGK